MLHEHWQTLLDILIPGFCELPSPCQSLIHVSKVVGKYCPALELDRYLLPSMSIAKIAPKSPLNMVVVVIHLLNHAISHTQFHPPRISSALSRRGG